MRFSYVNQEKGLGNSDGNGNKSCDYKSGFRLNEKKFNQEVS